MCTRIYVFYADIGTNFHGTSNYLSVLDWNEITKTTLLNKITWKLLLNPPTAAWWYGWWEGLIGLLKPLLVCTILLIRMNWALLSVSAKPRTYNEQPLTYASDELTELTPLKPSMFLKELTIDWFQYDKENSMAGGTSDLSFSRSRW